VDRSHRALDVQGSDVLPVLLEERYEEVNGGLNVVVQLLLSHVDASDSDTHAQNLLHLEFDGALDLSNLSLDVIVVGNQGWELSSLVQSWTKKTRNLTDDNLRSEEVVILLSQLLDELLVAVELLKSFNITRVDLELFGNLTMDGISENTELHALLASKRQTDRSTETLVTLRIVVLKRDLEFDGLDELSLLISVRESKDILDGLFEDCWWDFAHFAKMKVMV